MKIHLLHNPGFFQCLLPSLSVHHGHFGLLQQIHYLPRLVLLATSHVLALSNVPLIP